MNLRRRRRDLTLLAITLATLAAVAIAHAFDIRQTSEDATTVTLTWDKQSVDGYRFYLDGVPVSRTFDPNRTSVRFQKGARYEIAPLTITEGARSTFPPPVTPPPPPPPAEGNLIRVTGTLTPGQLVQAAGFARPITVRGPVTVTGSLGIPAGVRLEQATVQGNITLGTGSAFVQSSARGFDVTNGADQWTIEQSSFDGGGGDNQNLIWDTSTGDGSVGWRITGSTFRNFYAGWDPSVHSEAIYVGGGSRQGLIEGNVFDRNGNTAHVFFTWFGGSGTTAAYPRDICVRDNTFGPTYNGSGLAAYFMTNVHPDVPVSATISISPGNRRTGAQALASRPEFVRDC